MNYQTDPVNNYFTSAPMIILSDDGYVRLTWEIFLATPLLHLVSGMDEDSPIHPHEGASLSRISGYTEWVSATTPIITLGWDWVLDGGTQGQAIYMKVEAPRCNVMLIDAMHRDLGSATTLELLGTAIDTHTWREEVHKHIVARYA